MANAKISDTSVFVNTITDITNIDGFAAYATASGTGNAAMSGSAMVTSLEANLDLSNFTTGILPVPRGGTGVGTLADGHILLGSGANAISTLDLTTKGSIVVGDGATDPIALGVGANGEVLTADSAEPSGVKWSCSTSGGVSSITFGTTGLTPSVASTGAVTVAGTLSASNGGTGFTGPSNIGDIIAANTASSWTSIAAGTIDHVLTSLGPGILPIWKAAPGGTNRWTVEGSFQGWKEANAELTVPMVTNYSGGSGAGGLDDIGVWRAPFDCTIENIYMGWAFELVFSPPGAQVDVHLYKISAADWSTTKKANVLADWGSPLMTGAIPNVNAGGANDFWEDTFSAPGSVNLSAGDYVAIMMASTPAGGSNANAAIWVQMVITE